MIFFYRLLLTFNATSLIIVIYLVKEKLSINNLLDSKLCNLPNYVSYIIYSLIPVLLTYLSLLIAKSLSKDNIKEASILSVEQANNAFLPSYLGYFFVALSIPYEETLIFVFAILFIFTFLSQTLYFNPLFLIFGYHFYYLNTSNNVQIFVITRKVLKEPKSIKIEQLRRINNFTFIDIKK